MKLLIKIFIAIAVSLSFSYLLIEKGLNAYIISSSSMEPTIKVGSLTLISKFSKYKTGDIITYKTYKNKVPITHRVIKIFKLNNKYFLYLKGDNNESEDPYPISQDEIEGKVFLVIPYVGQVKRALTSYKLIGLTIYFPAGIFIGKTIRFILKKT